MHSLKKLVRDRRGQALVELALELPLLILLVMGTIEFGRIFHSYLMITSASREGARTAILGESDIAIKEKVKSAASSLELEDSKINIEPEQSSRTRGVPLTVTVGCQVNLITPVLEAVVPNPFNLTASTTMRME